MRGRKLLLPAHAELSWSAGRRSSGAGSSGGVRPAGAAHPGWQSACTWPDAVLAPPGPLSQPMHAPLPDWCSVPAPSCRACTMTPALPRCCAAGRRPARQEGAGADVSVTSRVRLLSNYRNVHIIRITKHTKHTIRLQVQLLTSMYSVTSMVWSGPRYAPCEGGGGQSSQVGIRYVKHAGQIGGSCGGPSTRPARAGEGGKIEWLVTERRLKREARSGALVGNQVCRPGLAGAGTTNTPVDCGPDGARCNWQRATRPGG